MFKKLALTLLIAVLLLQAWPAHAAEEPITLGGGRLTSLALSPDGARLAAASSIGVYFFDPQTFALTGFWPTTHAIDQVAWSPRGDVVALLTSGHNLEARRAETGAVLWHDQPAHCSGWYYAYCLLTFSRDGSQVATLSNDSTASVYNPATGALSETVRNEAFWSFSDWRLANLADSAWQSTDGKLAFIGSYKYEGAAAFLYDTPRRLYITPIHLTYTYYMYDPSRIALSPNGKLLAAGEDRGNVSVWDVASAAGPQQTFTGYPDSIFSHAFAWSPDSAVLYVAYGNSLDAWDVRTGQRLRRLPGLFTPSIGQIAWSSDGRRIIAAQDRQLGDWDLATRQPVAAAPLTAFENPTWRINEMAASPAGNLVAVADVGGVTLHDPTTLRALRRMQVGRSVMALAFSPDGKLLATGGQGPFVNVWEAATGRPVVDLPASPWCQFIVALTFAPDGRTVYALESTGLLRHWDVETKSSATVQTQLPWSPYYYDPAIHVPVRRVAVEMRRTQTIAVADLETGNTLFSVNAPWPRSVAIDPQGTRLAAIVGAEVKVWKLDTGQEVATFGGHTTTISDIAFSPDGRSLASSSQDGTVKVWPVP